MYPPSQVMNLNIEALSGICGSVSIACWIVVFSPQIVENFRTRAEGLSVVFIIVWSLGDVFNAVGGLMQGVLPTMIILAIYYLLVDIVLLGQCFYYKGFTMTDVVHPKPKPSNGNTDTEIGIATERTALLGESGHESNINHPERQALKRTGSQHSFTERFFSVDATHLSPATPLHADAKRGEPEPISAPRSMIQTVAINFLVVILVILAGVLGWWLRHQNDIPTSGKREDAPAFNILGQIFGYICSVLYLGSRVPQLLLNYRRKSTEGISMMFFFFACLGNLTYNMSIFAYDPQGACEVPMHCHAAEARSIYGKEIAVNLPWILGSLGTFCLDMGVFVQYFLYRTDDEFSDEEEATSPVEDAVETPVRREGVRSRNVAFVDES